VSASQRRTDQLHIHKVCFRVACGHKYSGCILATTSPV
jgi:hypothetical protein